MTSHDGYGLDIGAGSSGMKVAALAAAVAESALNHP